MQLESLSDPSSPASSSTASALGRLTYDGIWQVFWSSRTREYRSNKGASLVYESDEPPLVTGVVRSDWHGITSPQAVPGEKVSNKPP